MEAMEAIGNYGILIVIAGLFLYEHISVNKKTKAIQEQNTGLLKEMQETNKNTAKALEILKENQSHMIVVTERIEYKIDTANNFAKGEF